MNRANFGYWVFVARHPQLWRMVGRMTYLELRLKYLYFKGRLMYELSWYWTLLASEFTYFQIWLIVGGEQARQIKKELHQEFANEQRLEKWKQDNAKVD